MTYLIIEETQYISTEKKLTKEQEETIGKMIENDIYSITEIAQYLNAKSHHRQVNASTMEIEELNIEEVLNSLMKIFPSPI